MKTIPLAVRRRILAACEREGSTRGQVARRFGVSLGMVKKLLAQRKHLGDIRAQYHRCGRKPLIDATVCRRLQDLLQSRPSATLREMRQAVGLNCTLPALHYALRRAGLARGQKVRRRKSIPSSRSRHRS